MHYDLERFTEGQKDDYEQALSEIKAGRKKTHWIWYIFPQIEGLGFSHMSKYYGIRGMEEAKAYMENDTLRQHLLEISDALLHLRTNDPNAVMGSPDDLKLKSSMTLFALAAPEYEVFQKVLDKYFFGEMDEKTIEILTNESTT